MSYRQIRENVITSENAGRIRCKILREGAKGPTTSVADSILQDKKISLRTVSHNCESQDQTIGPGTRPSVRRKSSLLPYRIQRLPTVVYSAAFC